MSRSNPISLLLGLFFVACLGVTWVWTHKVGYQLQLISTWATLLFGCGSGFYIWQHGLRCARLIHDVPLSNIGTAAQGYVELLGRACLFEDQKAKSIAGIPVLWFRRETARRSDSEHHGVFPFNLFYVPTNVEESQTPFKVEDQTGNACVLPYGAEIICSRKFVNYSDDGRITEEQIMEGDLIYVVGSFSTAATQFDFQEEYNALADKWREDSTQRARFDTNHDGRLDSRELMALHKAVAAEIEEKESRALGDRQANIIHQPADGRMFLISTIHPKELAGHYYWWLGLGLVMFVGCGALAAWMITSHLFKI
jgi:hypothetical protein